MLMADGHDPRDVAEYPWRDVQAFMIVRQYLNRYR